MLFLGDIVKMPNRILFLLTQDLQSPSGLGRYLPLAVGLAQRGLEVQVAALHSNFEELAERCTQIGGVSVEYVAPMHVKKTGSSKTYYSPPKLLLLTLNAAWQLSRAALRDPADILYVCKPHPMNSLAALVGKLLGPSRRLYLDCDDYEAASNRFSSGWQRRGVTLFEDGMPARAERVTCNTYFTMDRLRNLGVPNNRLVYLPNGVDRARFTPPPEDQLEKLRAELGLSGRRVIVYVGSLSLPSHPVDLLLQAFNQVHSHFPEARLLIVGGGEDLPVLQSMAQAMGLGESVCFTGRVPANEAPLYYRLGDISVDPVYDTLAAAGRAPLKMFESWAAGVPFVTVDVGDRRRLAGDLPAALLARPGSADNLAEVIEQLLSQPHLAQRLREQGLRQVEEYDWERIVERSAWVFQPGQPHPMI